MTPRAVVVDTNVVVAGLMTEDPESPTARVLDGMVEGRFVVLLSTALVAEYRRVLLRRAIADRHGLSERQIDRLLTEVVVNAVVREPGRSTRSAPDRADQHLWDLLGCEHGSVLVTGDRELMRDPPQGTSVLSPAGFVELWS